MSRKNARASVCVVICNFNKANDLIVAVDSVLASTNVDVEIIVVDNCSTDGSVDAIRSLGHVQVEVVALQANIGGSGGFKVGMDLASQRSAEFVLLLDNDASVAPDTISGLVGALELDSSVGAVGPAILRAYDPSEVQDVGGFISSTYFCHHPGFSCLPYKAIPKGPLLCEYLASCCLLTRQSVLSRIGGFEPGFFIYWDDVDWCTRVRDMGLSLMVLPHLRAWHKGGIQSARGTKPTYFNLRNRVHFFRRYPMRWDFDQAKSGIELNLREIAFGCLLKRDFGYIRANLSGFNDGLNGAFGAGHPADLPDRTSFQSPSLPLTRGGTYALHLDDWFLTDDTEIGRVNTAVTHGDYYRLSRLLAAIKELKKRFAIRILLDRSIWLRFDRVGQLVLSDFVEVYAVRERIPRIRLFRHLLDSVDQASKNEITTDSFLNVIPSDLKMSAILDEVSSLCDEYSAPPSQWQST